MPVLKSLFSDSSTPLFDLGAAAFSLDEFSLLRGRSPGLPAACPGRLRAELQPACFTAFGDLFGQAFAGDGPVHALAARVGDGHGDPRGQMGQGDGRGDLVHMLSPRPCRPGKALPEFLLR